MKYRWFRWLYVLCSPCLMAPFIVCGIMLVDAIGEDHAQFLATIPLLIFSILLSYATLAHLVNSTEIAIEGDLVTVRHGPIPWKGCAYPLVDCEEFFADKIKTGRFVFPGVRIRFEDDTYEDLTYSKSLEQAQEWAEELNQGLAEFPHSRPMTET